MKKKLLKLIFFYSFFFSVAIFLLPQTYPFHNYSEKDGLPTSRVYSFFQDSKGYLWITTFDGIFRFDGKEFKNFKDRDRLLGDIIYSIFEDSCKNVWLTTKNGLCCFLNGNFSKSARKDYLRNQTIHSIVEDETKKLWFASSGGLFYFDGKSLIPLSPSKTLNTKNIYSIVTGDRGYIWLGTDKGIAYFDTKILNTCASYSEKEGLLTNDISTLCYDSFGTLWIGTSKGINRLINKKVLTYVEKSSHMYSDPAPQTSFPRHECLSGNEINNILEDQDRNIWIGTTKGISLYSGNNFITLKTTNGFPNNFITSMYRDFEGNIWIGTYSGASCLKNIKIKTYSKEDGFPGKKVSDLIWDKKGNIWLSTTEGLSCLNRNKFINYTVDNGLISVNNNKLMEDGNGNIWCVTSDGLSIFASGKFTNYTKKNGLASNIIFDAIENKDKSIWIASKNGIICYRNKKFSQPLFSTKGVQFIRLFKGSNGRIWSITPFRVFCYYNDSFIDISKQYSIPERLIAAISEDSKGRLWLCTKAGLGCLRNGKYRHFSANNNALLDDMCYGIAEDNNGYLWITHPKGLTCFDGNNFKTIATYTSERLGLTARTWTKGIKDEKGDLWFATSDGLVTFSPPPVQPVKTPPPVYITGLKVMEKPISLETTHEFPHDRNIFRFNYTGIHFTQPEAVSYKYKLEGLDSKWNITKDRSLFYPFLPPKKYTFKVIAINCDGVESTKPAEYSFIIHPPFWNTSWFYLIILLFAGSLLTIFFKWHIKRIKEKTELKELNRQLVTSQRMELMGTLAAGTVHDLKNLMAIIVGYTRMMSQTFQKNKDNNGKANENPETDENAEYLDIINNTASTAVQMSKQILSFARPKNIDNAPVELEEVLSEILDTLKVSQPKNIKLTWKPSSEPVYLIINPARLQQVVMNLCLNAFDAMPRGGEVTVSLSVQENTDSKKNKSNKNIIKEILVEVADTGQEGIKKEDLKKIFEPLFTTKSREKGTGLGLFVVKQIVDEYNGRIDVKSEPGIGTTFSIYFPYTDPETF